MKSELLQEFRPAIKFLSIFVLVYFAGNIIYGIWIESWKPLPDPMTAIVTNQTVLLLNAFNEPVSAIGNQGSPTVSVVKSGYGSVLRVFEGCNGINVMIVFAGFLIAFGGRFKNLIFFLVAGIVCIHVVNLFRVMLLYYTAINQPRFFYYFHKYFFTAILYAVVFALWYLWVKRSGIKLEKLASPQKQAE